MADVEIYDKMIGQTFKSVTGEVGKDKLSFDKVFVFYHHQECCESVLIEEIIGDLNDLVGSPLIQAESVTKEGDALNEYGDTITWTFLKFATIKGSVTVRWYGTSNGYYSESVDFCDLRTKQNT